MDGRMHAESPGDQGTEAPLAGIRVADFSRVLAGPYATMMLADFGADVIKVESPHGDDTRSWLPPVDAAGESTYFAAVNRNKRSIVCDLRTDAGLAEARRLASAADVVIENFRPGVMERFGLDEATLRAADPGLIYCSITGFGRGDGAELAGYDLLVQAVGGLMSITGSPDGGPTKVGVALVDVLTGLNAFSGILLALRERERTGLGQRIDVDLLTSLLAALTNQASSTLATGVSPHRMGNAHPSIAPYEVYNAADRALAIAVGNDRQFRDFATVLGRHGLADDTRFATNADRVRNRETLRALVEEALAGRTAAEWVDACAAARVPAGPVNTIGEAFDFAARLGLDPTVHIDDQASGRVAVQPANPIHLSRSAAGYHSVAPLLGEHPGAGWPEPYPHPHPHTTEEGRP